MLNKTLFLNQKDKKQNKIDVYAAATYYYSFIKCVYVAICLVNKYVQQKLIKTSVGWRKKKAVCHNEEILLRIVASI